MKKIVSNLTFWVLTSIIAGALLGNFAPGTAVKMKFLSDLFIFLVTWFIYPIIFLTITLGISGMSNLKKVGRVGGKALLYFEIVTTFALITGLLVVNVIKPGAGVNITSVKQADISQYTQQANGFSLWHFLKSNITIQVLLLAIICGILLSRYHLKMAVIDILSLFSKYIFLVLKYFMFLAPLAAFGGMAYTVGKFGLATLLPLGKLMLTVYVTMGLFIFVVLKIILQTYKVSLWKFLRYIRAELLIVLGTSSSEAALPSLMQKLEKMGCSKSVVGLVVPAGYSFNLDGTTIYLSMSILFLAQVYNIPLSFSQEMTILAVLFVTSKGAAGVAGSGFIVLISTLNAIKVIPLEGLSLLLAVDRFMSEARAITNFIGNGVSTVWISNNEKEFDRAKMNAEFSDVTASDNA